ncbi:galactinol synthase 2 isoform X1 [Glycine max]|uniref:galactinol synthase 2 isoform X1 n=1 Tax=Glycine max TaxID=3847 RepID=UPI001B35531A|nr:galactinol synthase 2 isoform X1 [Glycine max]
MPPNITTVVANVTTEQLPKARGGSGRAFVTFLAGNGDYVKGVVGLAKGLRKAKSMYPLVVAVLPDVPEEHREILKSQGCIVREIEPVYPPENQTQFAMAYYVINYSKLRIWEFVEYKKTIYLDGDIQVFGNIDHLFDLPDNYFYAVMDCFCEKTWSHTPQFQIGYCQQCPDKPTSFAEQDFLNMYFKDKYKPIPNMYNLVLAMLWRHPENVELDKVQVVHYCAAGSKPWRFTGKEENMDREDIKMLVKKWWDIYEDETLDYNNNSVNVERFTSALLDAGGFQFVPAPSAA